MLRRTVRVSDIGIDTWHFESTVSNELTIEICEGVADTAEIQMQAVDETAPHGWRFTSITVADLRHLLEQRDEQAAAMLEPK
jgi:hypothetical protein